MATRYQYPCPKCGGLNPVTLTMAGQELPCSHCGQSIEIPQLKVLKELKPADSQSQSQAAHRSRSSSPVANLLFVTGLVIMLLGIAAGLGLQKYASPMVVDFSTAQQQLEEQAASLSPGGILREWYLVEKRPELPEWREHPAVRYRNQGLILQQFAQGFLVLGGIGFLLLLASFLFRLKKN